MQSRASFDTKVFLNSGRTALALNVAFCTWFLGLRSWDLCLKHIRRSFDPSSWYSPYCAMLTLQKLIVCLSYTSWVSKFPFHTTIVSITPNYSLYHLLLLIFTRSFWKDLPSLIICILGHCNSSLNPIAAVISFNIEMCILHRFQEINILFFYNWSMIRLSLIQGSSQVNFRLLLKVPSKSPLYLIMKYWK